MSDKVEGTKQKVKSKAEVGNSPLPDLDMFGNRLTLPKHIQKELDEAGLKHRFVSVKKMQDAGGYHPMGWTPYTLKNPRANPITGVAESTFRVGDLILAVKTQADYEKHRAWLAQKSNSQSQHQKNSIKEMKERLKEGGIANHVKLLEGYEEND